MVTLDVCPLWLTRSAIMCTKWKMKQESGAIESDRWRDVNVEWMHMQSLRDNADDWPKTKTI